MKIFGTWILCSSLILVSCVTPKQLDEKLLEERSANEQKLAEIQQKLFNQNAAIAMLKDSVLNAEKRMNETVKTGMDVYEKSVLVHDYKTATSALQLITTLKPNDYIWAYDSLAYYHYFHTDVRELARSTYTLQYFINKGLSLNKNNRFLLELKARTLLIEQKDTASLELFQQLYASTGDLTYHWYAIYIELARNNLKTGENEINKILSQEISGLKKVRLDHLPEHTRESVNAKAAFIYLKSIIYQSREQYQKVADTLKDALKIAPDFYLAAKSLEELQQASQGMYK